MPTTHQIEVRADADLTVSRGSRVDGEPRGRLRALAGLVGRYDDDEVRGAVTERQAVHRHKRVARSLGEGLDVKESRDRSRLLCCARRFLYRDKRRKCEKNTDRRNNICLL